jgi:hypothetical protein
MPESTTQKIKDSRKGRAPAQSAIVRPIRHYQQENILQRKIGFEIRRKQDAVPFPGFVSIDAQIPARSCRNTARGGETKRIGVWACRRVGVWEKRNGVSAYRRMGRAKQRVELKRRTLRQGKASRFAFSEPVKALCNSVFGQSRRTGG